MSKTEIRLEGQETVKQFENKQEKRKQGVRTETPGEAAAERPRFNTCTFAFGLTSLLFPEVKRDTLMRKSCITDYIIKNIYIGNKVEDTEMN